MEVKLLTPECFIKEMENVAALAALTCRANTEREYIPREVLGRIIKAGHESILEHITLTYSVKWLSRACLQEVARHRHISLSVESTRHTLMKRLKDAEWHNKMWEACPKRCAGIVQHLLEVIAGYGDIPNDELKYYVPEFWPTNLIMTGNIRELRHILKLRTSPAALNEFRVLGYSLYEAVPEEYRYLLEDCVYREKSE